MNNKTEAFYVLFAAEDGNINGDPDMGGAPRIDSATGRGFATSFCIKRQIRNVLEQMGHSIALRSSDLNIESLCEKVLEAKGIKSGKKKYSREEVDKGLNAFLSYMDIKLFGLTDCKHGVGNINGPVQIEMAFTPNRIRVETITITRCMAGSDKQQKEKGDDTMGPFHYAPGFNLYVARGHISGHHADVNKMTPFDRELMFKAMYDSFTNNSPSVMRGRVYCHDIYRFTQKKGGMRRTANLMSVSLNEGVSVPTTIDDYTIKVNQEYLDSNDITFSRGYDQDILNHGIKKVG